ncbi:MAG: 6-phosphogluconolactonase [Deltaproteobacteria bacterium]|nr:6-phosphogluconolactonase [Deltaproteobacteria bacterium]
MAREAAREPRITVAADAGALAALAAAEIARTATRAAEARGLAAIALAGGSTPIRTYRRLAEPEEHEGVPWERVLFFFGDERCVPPDHPDSNTRMVREALLARLPIPAANVFRMAGELDDPERAAAAYEADLRQELGPAPRLDLAILGMGVDGHVASLFPGSPALEERTRLVCAATGGQPQPRRLTLTLPALCAARAVLFLVSGAEKAGTVAEVLAGRRPDLPASRVRPEGEVHWLLDPEAASRIR